MESPQHLPEEQQTFSFNGMEEQAPDADPFNVDAVSVYIAEHSPRLVEYDKRMSTAAQDQLGPQTTVEPPLKEPRWKTDPAKRNSGLELPGRNFRGSELPRPQDVTHTLEQKSAAEIGLKNAREALQDARDRKAS